MPTYDYKCNDCGHAFEEFQKMTDEPLKICPECGGNVKRLIGAGAGLVFNGSGFYITDYKDNKKSSSSNNKSDSKPETKKTENNKPAKTDNKAS